jgi:ABC-type multidrug transport system fused ATPase/permease subunit
MAQEAGNPWRALVELIRPEWRRYGLLMVAVTSTALLPLVGPLLVGRVVDAVGAGDGVGAAAGTVVGYGVAFLLVTILAQFVSVATTWYGNTIAWRTANRLRVGLTRHVLGLDHEFHRSHTPGELIQRIDGDVTHVSDFLGRVVAVIGSAVLTVVGVLVVLTLIDWRLGLIMVVYAGVGTAALLVMRGEAVAETELSMNAQARLYGGIEERITASEDLRGNGAGTHAVRRFVEDATLNVERRVDEEKAFMRLWWGLQGSVAGGAVLALIAGGWLVSRGAITLGAAFVLFQYTQVLKRPMEDIVDRIEMVQKASAAMIRVADLLAVEGTITEPDHPLSPPPGPLSVTFENVSFDYGDGQPVLHDINLSLAAGSTVGVVGRTGGGKSTLSRLVLRLIDAAEGRVLLGGVPIERIGLSELRHRVALIPQEVQLVNGTLRDNVTLFDDASIGGPGDAEVEEAIRQVGLGSLIDPEVNPDGIHTRLAAGGAGLSAGESQLLALARVWLRNPDVVVLDEATARVDPETEARLHRAVHRLLAGRTAVIIAHRLSTLREVDDIVVVHEGRIIEHGPRAELEADQTGRFRRLLDLALETDDDEGDTGDGTSREDEVAAS